MVISKKVLTGRLLPAALLAFAALLCQPAWADGSDADAALEDLRFEKEVERVERDNAQKLEDYEQAQEDYDANYERIQSQQEAMRKAQQTKQQQAAAAQALGQILVMGGSLAMMAGQEQVGMWLMGGGIAASAVGMVIGLNANKSGSSADDLSSLTPPQQPQLEDAPTRGGEGGTLTSSGGILGADGGTNGVPTAEESSSGAINKLTLSPEDLRTGTLGALYDQFEEQTGIPREDFSRALAEGVSPAELLDGVNGLDGDKIQAGIDAAKNSFTGPNGAGNLTAAAEELGAGDLAKQVLDNSGASRATEWSGGGKGLASTGGKGGKKPDLAGFDFDKPAKDEFGASTQGFNVDPEKMHPEVRKKYEQQKRDRSSIFTIVHLRYQQYSPMLLGYGPTITRK